MESRIYDIETFSNLFTFVAKVPGEKNTYEEFIIFDDVETDEFVNQGEELYQYLKQKKHIFFGYNNLYFDGPVLEYIYEKKGKVKAKEIYQLAQNIISGEYYLPEYKFVTKQIDLYKMWSFNTSQRQCSLKWLEFSMRLRKLKDLPYEHTKEITARQVKEVIKYNKYDVDVTEQLYMLSEDKLELRKIVYKEYKDFSLFNKGDTDMGSYTFLLDLAKKMKTNKFELKNKGTYYDSLPIKDIILEDRLTFMKKSPFNELVEKYKTKVLYADEEGLLQTKGAVNESVEFGGITFDYGVGGLHASVSNKIIEADENFIIVDVDVASFYPNLAIKNKLHPKHLSNYFVQQYSDLYEERKKIPKSNPLNLSKKLSLNALFGKSNSKYSYLYDPAFTMGITINGQLQLSMLAEQLNRCSSLIQVNTDGVTVLVHKNNLDKIDKIIDWWEKKTELTLEKEFYKKMSICDVNTYHAMYSDKKVCDCGKSFYQHEKLFKNEKCECGNKFKLVEGGTKRKGRLCTYEDYSNPKSKDYHKNPSMTIVPKALDLWLSKGVPIHDTIYSEKNIHEFLIGVKKKSNFVFLIADTLDNGYTKLTTNSDRVIRFYAARKGSSIYKLTTTNGLTSLLKNVRTNVLQNIRSKDISKYENDIDYEWYVQKAQEVYDNLEHIKNEEFCTIY